MPTISPNSSWCTESHLCSRLEPCSTHSHRPGYFALPVLADPASPYPVQPGATSRSNPTLPPNLTRILGLPSLSLALIWVNAHSHVYQFCMLLSSACMHARWLPSRPEFQCHQPLIPEHVSLADDPPRFQHPAAIHDT
jgi:hypothetical protein